MERTMRRMIDLLLASWLAFGATASARDLDDIRREGVLRHLGVPYAHFVTGSGDGLDVELIQGFARDLGVRYEFVQTDWPHMFGDLTGQNARLDGDQVERFGETPIRGDLIANGLTVLGWRKQVVRYSEPTFPSGVWLITRAASPLHPIKPSGELENDIRATKASLNGVSVLASANSCLDPDLYQLDQTGADIRLAPEERTPDELIPALFNQDAETSLMDVSTTLLSLERWPGEIKVLGPISEQQTMAVGFRPDSPQLLAAFNDYLARVKADGSYPRTVKKYFPAMFDYFPNFFGEGGASK